MGAKSVYDFNVKRRFEVLRVGDCDRLIKHRHGGEELKFIAAFEDVFMTIDSAHKAVGHGGEKKTLKEAQQKKKWENITQKHAACSSRFVNHVMKRNLGRHRILWL